MAAGMTIKGGSFLIETVDVEEIFIPEDMDTNQKVLGKILEDYLRGEVEPRIDEMEKKTEGLMVNH